MSLDRTVLVDDCAQADHPAGQHRHVVFGGSCAHGVPSRYTCNDCEHGNPPAPAVAELPADWEERGVMLPLPGEKDVLVAPTTLVSLLSGRYVGGNTHLGERVARALVRAGWARETFRRGHIATDRLRTISGWSL